jgi:integrase/recombinase XerD
MTDTPVNPLRRRMIEDMTIRKLAPKTQASYIRAVRNFTEFLGRSSDRARAEDLRRYQLHLAASGVSVPRQNATVTALRFFFTVTLGRTGVADRMPLFREPRRLPVVLSPEEVAWFLHAAPGLEYKAALSVAYGRACARPR